MIRTLSNIPIFFIIVVISLIVFHLRLSYLNRRKSPRDKTEDYLRSDFEANFSKTRDIDEAMFIRLSERDLPFRYDYDGAVTEEAGILRVQEKVKLNLQMPLIKTDIESNVEIKRRFGAANLQTITDGEENLTRLIQRLNKWAKLLNGTGNEQDAERILETAVSCRSDISETYVLLYEIYRNTGRSSKIEELTKKIDELPNIARIRVNNYINNV